MKNIYLVIFVAIFAFASCQKQEIEPSKTTKEVANEVSKTKSAGNTMVILHQANIVNNYKVEGYVKVKNVAHHKQVTVRYKSSNDDNWTDVEATFHAMLDDGYEVWKFQTGEVPRSRYDIPAIEFAIRYTVNGQEYWDNNAGQNYSVRGIVGVQYSPDYILGYETMVDAKFSNHYDSPDVLHIFYWAYVQDVAYDKQVKLVYTTDGWATSQSHSASYSADNPGQENVDIWNGVFQVYGVEGKEVEAYIEYTVNGQTHYDNNYQMNYVFEQ